MRNILLLIICICSLHITSFAQTKPNTIDAIMPVRGLAIEAPSVRNLDLFLQFIE
ncbi:hypothetical protein EZS27_040126, partial [termite gut metagenome]